MKRGTAMSSSATNGDGQKRAILYARVSTAEQAESGYSLAQQLAALRDWCAANAYEVLEEVEDAGYSGASLNRPGMDRVRDLVSGTPGGVALVLAQDRDRFAREPAYLYLLKEEFGRHGCALRALNDRGDDSPEGELTDGILDQLAKFERAKTAERTRRGRLRKAREGKIIAGRTPDFGFAFTPDRSGYEVDPERQLLVDYKTVDRFPDARDVRLGGFKEGWVLQTNVYRWLLDGGPWPPRKYDPMASKLCLEWCPVREVCLERR
jgi:site-specific DNA recombinase